MKDYSDVPKMHLDKKSLAGMIQTVKNEIAITECNTTRMAFLLKRLTNLRDIWKKNSKKKTWKEPDYGK